ncbi:MAG: Glyoxalase/bleomycin resistance protein/dioxygenase [Fibrobacteres bacterium]|nr:Glyoxalase/bleomycin resistance protein/dioxygenase [Fibrobacterota bacterium]
MPSINPYLGFNGDCEKAFQFYKSVFGGEFAVIQRFKDVPSEMALPASEGEKIMHVSLPIGKNILMGSDRPAQMGPGTRGDGYSISFSADSQKEADRAFTGISAGGKVTMPIAKTFWGAYFGMCTDKFGIDWMVSFDENMPKP